MNTQQQVVKNPNLARRALTIYRCWRDLPEAKEATEVSKLVGFAYSQTIAPIQIRSELMELGQVIAAAKPLRALEIGTARGGTLFVLCRLAAPDATVISVDLPHGAFGGGYSPLRIPLYKRFASPGQSLHLIRGNSHDMDTLQRVRTILGSEPLDYLFIDADHTYEGVKRDFQMYSPLVRKGGTVAFHDIAPGQPGCEVPRFWGEIKDQYLSREIIDPKEGWGIGVLQI
jgi:predicted O-methyltransferase YrrM